MIYEANLSLCLVLFLLPFRTKAQSWSFNYLSSFKFLLVDFNSVDPQKLPLAVVDHLLKHVYVRLCCQVYLFAACLSEDYSMADKKVMARIKYHRQIFQAIH